MISEHLPVVEIPEYLLPSLQRSDRGTHVGEAGSQRNLSRVAELLDRNARAVRTTRKVDTGRMRDRVEGGAAAFHRQPSNLLLPAPRRQPHAKPRRVAIADEMQQRLNIQPFERLDQSPRPLQAAPFVILSNDDHRWRRFRCMDFEVSD